MMWVFPRLSIAIVVFAWNILGDSLRDVLDPRLRGPDNTAQASLARSIRQEKYITENTQAPLRRPDDIGVSIYFGQ